jgi:hypothetical protein
MIKPDFMTNRMIIAIIITMGGLSYSNLLTVTDQDPHNENSDIILSSKNVHNTTTIGDKIVHRGIFTSEEPTFLVPDPAEENQSVEILRHRQDGATYAGTLTFTATKPVEVGFGHRVHLDNLTISQLDSDKLGVLYTRLHLNNTEHATPGIILAPTRIMPNYGNSSPYYSASIPFVGSSVFLTTSGDPFIAVYEVVAEVLKPQIVLDIGEGTSNSTK